MRSAIVSYCLGFLALAGCASAPGYRSPAVQPPASFREVTEAPSPESPHPLSPSPFGRGGTKDEPAVSTDYWDQLGDTTLSRLVGEVQRANLDVRAARARVSAARSDRVRSALELTPSATVAAGHAPPRQVAAAQYRIGTLVGRSPSEVARELEQPRQLPSLPEVTSIGAPEAVVRYQPDVAAAERLAAARGALVGTAKASYLPRLTIGASAGYAAPEFNAVGNQGTLRYVVGPVLTWPALNLGRVKAEVDAAQAREEDARAQYSRVVLAALEDMETSLARYRAARVQVERLQEASAASERAAELARLRFKEGVTDFLQVLDAERTELEAQDRLAQGRIDAATAYAALYRAVGGR